MDAVKKVAGTAEQHGHGVPHISPHADERQKNAEQAAQHNRDLAKVERLHQRGLKK